MGAARVRARVGPSFGVDGFVEASGTLARQEYRVHWLAATTHTTRAGTVMFAKALLLALAAASEEPGRRRRWHGSGSLGAPADEDVLPAAEAERCGRYVSSGVGGNRRRPPPRVTRGVEEKRVRPQGAKSF